MAAIAVGVVLAAMGCGGGGDSGPLTKNQWMKQVIKDCAQIHNERYAEIQDFQKKLEKEGADVTSSENLEAGLHQVVIPSMHEQVEDLEAIEPPEKDRAKVEAIWAEYSRDLGELEKKGYAGSEKSGEFVFQPYLDKAFAYGLHDCEP